MNSKAAYKGQPVGYVSVLKTVSLLGAGFGLLLFCLPVFSQANLGRILGGISDQTGGAVAGATVTVVDVARGISRPLTADGAGEYNAPNLLPGTYTVRVEAKGFRTFERQNIPVQVGGEVRIDVVLQPGEQTQTITVTEALPMINTTNAALGGTIEQQVINDLPINGRNFQNLYDFTQGLMRHPGGGASGTTTNGLTAFQNNWMLEGLFNKSIYSAVPVIGGSNDIGESATILNLDAIQETTVIVNPKAEYGWVPGAVVNIGLKSGTNAIHGSAYGYGRDSAWDARNPFSPTRQNLTLEQFGAVMGGPIKKDKLFYFGSYEGKRLTTAQSGTIQLPTTASLPTASGSCGSTSVGDCTNSFPNAIADINKFIATHSGTSVSLSQLSLNLAGCVTSPAISCDVSKGIFGNGAASPTVSSLNTPNTSSSDNWIGKIDYHLSDHHSLNGEYLFGNNYTLESGSGGSAGVIPQLYWRRLNPIRGQVARATEVWTPNSTWVNEARFGWHRYDQNILIGECQQNLGQPDYAAAFGLLPGTQFPCALPGITITNFAGLGCQCNPQPRLDNTWQAADSVSYTHGTHLFKFGGEFRRSTFLGGTLSNVAGTLTFGGASSPAFTGATPLESFLAGVASSGAVLAGIPVRHTLQYFYAGFVQDDWRVTSRLTLNLGLRYEYTTVLKETSNLFGGFDPTAPAGIVQLGSPQLPSLYKPDRDNFGPRLGFAWDITGKGTTVLRAGGGLFYFFQSYTQHLGGGVQEQLDPTAGTLYNVNGGIVPSSGNIAAASISLLGGVGAGGSPNIPWAVNSPIFTTSGLAAVKCGNGLAPAAPVAPGALAKNPSPCNAGLIDPNIGSAYATEWNLSIDHAFTNNLSATVAYVGNHGTNEWFIVDQNQPVPGLTITTPVTTITTACPAPPCTSEQQRRPYYTSYPFLGRIGRLSSFAESNYNGFQATLNQRLSHGVSFKALYTLGHALDFGTSGNQSELSSDSTNPRADYGDGLIDVRNRFSFTASWAIPGRKAPGQILEGWQINSIVLLESRIPFNGIDSSDDISGTGEGLDRWTLAGKASDFNIGGPALVQCFGIANSSFAKANNCTLVAAMPAPCLAAAGAEPLSPSGVATTSASAVSGAPSVGQNTGTFNLYKFGCYMSGGSVMVPPAQGTFGQMARDQLRGPGLREWEVSVQKNVKFNERLTAQFRAEFYNVLNNVNYGTLSGSAANLGSPANFGQATTTGNSGNAINGTGGPRSVQLGLKFLF